jgi:hypothetical protein
VKTAMYLVPVLAVTVFFLIRAELLEKRRQIYVIKPLSTLLVIAVAAVSFLEPTRNLTYTIGVLVGLLFSLGGDIALMFQENRRAFTLGLALFLVAHIVYVVTFTLLGRFSGWDILSTVVLLIAALGFYGLIPGTLGISEPRFQWWASTDDCRWRGVILLLGRDSGGEPILASLEIPPCQPGVLLQRSTAYCLGCQLFCVTEIIYANRSRQDGFHFW